MKLINYRNKLPLVYYLLPAQKKNLSLCAAIIPSDIRYRNTIRKHIKKYAARIDWQSIYSR